MSIGGNEAVEEMEENPNNWHTVKCQYCGNSTGEISFSIIMMNILVRLVTRRWIKISFLTIIQYIGKLALS